MRAAGTTLLLTMTILAAPLCTAAGAQNSTQGPPPDSRKEGGAEGDPSGAIRALGGTSTSDFKESDMPVKVPDIGARKGADRTPALPEGTTGPGSSR